LIAQLKRLCLTLEQTPEHDVPKSDVPETAE